MATPKNWSDDLENIQNFNRAIEEQDYPAATESLKAMASDEVKQALVDADDLDER